MHEDGKINQINFKDIWIVVVYDSVDYREDIHTINYSPHLLQQPTQQPTQPNSPHLLQQERNFKPI